MAGKSTKELVEEILLRIQGLTDQTESDRARLEALENRTPVAVAPRPPPPAAAEPVRAGARPDTAGPTLYGPSGRPLRAEAPAPLPNPQPVGRTPDVVYVGKPERTSVLSPELVKLLTACAPIVLQHFLNRPDPVAQGFKYAEKIVKLQNPAPLEAEPEPEMGLADVVQVVQGFLKGQAGGGGSAGGVDIAELAKSGILQRFASGQSAVDGDGGAS